jgi:pyridoxamine 5'-phosphate oxidase
VSLRAKIISLKGLFKGLDAADLAGDPIGQFLGWYRTARRAGMCLPDAVAFSTVSPEGRPSTRMMLYKGVSEKGFRLYTNYNSRKGLELDENPYAALTFFWNELYRQVRIEGTVSRMTREESDAYFQRRPRGSRLGAWASRQSREISDRDALKRAVREFELMYRGKDIPLPPFWGGYHLAPDAFEFWQGRPHRLHDRFRYTRSDDGRWALARLSP